MAKFMFKCDVTEFIDKTVWTCSDDGDVEEGEGEENDLGEDDIDTDEEDGDANSNEESGSESDNCYSNPYLDSRKEDLGDMYSSAIKSLSKSTAEDKANKVSISPCHYL